jgi:hypothetical protein
MPTGRHNKGPAADDPGLTRRRFLRAAGVGTAGAMVAAGAVVGQAGAQDAGAAVPGGAAPKIPARRNVVRAGSQRSAAAAALAVSGPLAFHTISPQRYLDTRFDGGGAFPADSDVIPLVSNVNWSARRRWPTTPSWPRPPRARATSRPASACTTPPPRAAST